MKIEQTAVLVDTMSKQPHKEITCPTCKKRGAWFETPYGPFCSKRCRLIDLGKWLGEEHRLGSVPVIDNNPDVQ